MITFDCPVLEADQVPTDSDYGSSQGAHHYSKVNQRVARV